MAVGYAGRSVEGDVEAISTTESLPQGDTFAPRQDLHFQNLADAPSSFSIGEPDARTRAYIDEYERRTQVGQPVGVYSLKDVIVSGQWGFVTDASETRIYNHLPGFGWNPQHIEHALSDVPLSEMTRVEGPSADGATLLSFPGALTYGHWLVDIALRLEVDRTVQGSAQRYIVPDPVLPWMLPILQANGVSLKQLHPIGRTQSIRIAGLRVPTITGHDGVINQKFAPQTFRRARGALLSAAPAARCRQVLFPIHTTQTSVHAPRNLVNRDELIAALATRFDLHVIDPLGMPLPEQISAFSNADLVLGEDSSALHNVVWGEHADLVVVAPPHRNNFFHAGIQQANQNQLQMLWGDEVDDKGGFAINIECALDAVRQTLDYRTDSLPRRRALKLS
jgi:hypothetical protein